MTKQQLQCQYCRYYYRCISHFGSECKYQQGNRIPKMRLSYKRLYTEEKAKKVLERYDLTGEKIISRSELLAGVWPW